MSYPCDVCGKNLVDKFGEWCSECQDEQYFLGMESEAIWYGESQKCQMCGNAWGPDPSDDCEAYNMPLYMVKRKYKCKKFKEYKEIEQ